VVICQSGGRIQLSISDRMVSLASWTGLVIPTLLFGLREKTISECTFRLRSLFSRRPFTARYVAASACNLDMIWMSLGLASSRDLKKRESVQWNGMRRMGKRETALTTLASMSAYSKSVFPASSC
jgi:hypothetical protein